MILKKWMKILNWIMHLCETFTITVYYLWSVFFQFFNVSTKGITKSFLTFRNIKKNINTRTWPNINKINHNDNLIYAENLVVSSVFAPPKTPNKSFYNRKGQSHCISKIHILLSTCQDSSYFVDVTRRPKNSNHNIISNLASKRFT